MSTGHSGLSGASYSVFISVGTSWSIKPQNRGLYSNNVQNQDGCKKPVWVDRVADLASYLLLLSHITLKKKANKSNKVMLKLFTFFFNRLKWPKTIWNSKKHEMNEKYKISFQFTWTWKDTCPFSSLVVKWGVKDFNTESCVHSLTNFMALEPMQNSL